MLAIGSRRASALVAALAVFLSATVAMLPGGGQCGQCVPGCPMHARRLPCHQAAAPHCHESATTGLRGSCNHRVLVVQTSPLRAVMPLLVALATVATPPAPPPDLPQLSGIPSPEPPTEPPRART